MDARKFKSDHCSIKLYVLDGTSESVSKLLIMIFSIFLMLTIVCCSKPSSNSEKPLLPSYGEGFQEVIIFTDYFCSPCQALESEMDPILNKLMEKGDVKITFVDAPVNKFTQLYARYFLFSVNTGADFKKILHIRHVLFSIAKTNTVFTEEQIASELRAQGIVFQPYNLTSVYALLNEMIKDYNIRSTPSCIVKYSDGDIRHYTGSRDIKQGLLFLLSAQATAKTS